MYSDCYFDVKPMTDDPIYWVRFFTITLFNHRIYRWARILTLIVYVTLTAINIYFFITIFDQAFLFRFSATFLALVSVIIYNACILWAEESFKYLDDEIRSILWSTTSTTEETEKMIAKQSKLVTTFVLINTVLGVVCGFVIYPVGGEQEYEFPIYFFRKYLPNVHYIFEFFYFLTFPISSYLMCNLANVLAYYTYHVKNQVELTLDVVHYVMKEYEHESDDVLINSPEFQRLITRRTRFIIKTHIEILRINKLSAELTAKLLPWISIGVIAMGLGLLSYVFLVKAHFGYWRYFQIIFWVSMGSYNSLILTVCGQFIENKSEEVYNTFYDVRWMALNRSNKINLLIMLAIVQRTLKLSFTHTVSLNAELALRIAKYLYSFIAIFSQIKDSTFANYI